MPQQQDYLSLTNKIVANIKRTVPSTATFTSTQNVVVIDSSNVRIGVNTMTPQFAIDVSGTNAQSWINTKNLNVANLAKIGKITCNTIESDSIILKDVSTNFVNTISGSITYLDSSYISVGTIDCETLNSTNYINFYELSGRHLTIKNIDTGDITVKGLITFNQDIATVNLRSNTLTISGNAINTVPTISGNILNYRYITATDTCFNRLYVISEASFNAVTISGAIINNTLTVSGGSTFNTINVNNRASFSTIVVSGIINTTTISANFLTINGTSFAGGTSIGTSTIDGCFNNIVVNRNLGFKDPSGGSYPVAGADFSNAYLLLPKTTINKATNKAQFDQSIYFTGQYLYVGDNRIFIQLNYANITLNSDVSGNRVYFNAATQNYSIDSSDLLVNKANSNYKYIPLRIDSSINQGVDVCNNKYIVLTTPDYSNNIYELHATLTVKYLNKIPGDVEPNIYTFGLYPHFIDPLNPSTDTSVNQFMDISNAFLAVKNTVIVFDNNYNYSQSNINYMAKIASRPIQNIGDISYNCDGFSFMVSSNKDINYMAIDNFNCTIKQVA